MEPDTTVSTGKRETLSIIVIIVLIVLGGVFYGIDLYRKANTPALPVSDTMAIGTAAVTSPD